ncbi:MAG: PKD domain-containing protein [Acidobacteriota bacterium]
MNRSRNAVLTSLLISGLAAVAAEAACPSGPAVSDETFYVFARSPVVVDVLANDAHPCGVPLELLTVTDLGCPGEVVENVDDTITFRPTDAFSGSCQVRYEVGDEEDAAPVTGLLTLDGTFLPPLLPTPLDERRREALHAWNDHLWLSGPGRLGGDHDRPDHEAYHWQKALVLLALHELGELDDSAVEDARALIAALYQFWLENPDEKRFELGNRNLAMRVFLLYGSTLFPPEETAHEDLREAFEADMGMESAAQGPQDCDPASCTCGATENHLMINNSFKLLSKQAADVETTDPGYLAIRDWWLDFLPWAISNGFSEWASSGEYETWTWTAILNLADLAADEEVRELATIAIDYNLALQAGQSAAGGMFASGGTRAYHYEILGDYRQTRTHLAQLLMTGGDLTEHGGGIHGPVAFAVSNYRPLVLVDEVFRNGLVAGETALTIQQGRYRQSCSPWFQHTYRGKTFALGANVTPKAAYYEPHDTVIGYVSTTTSPTSHVVPIGYHPEEWNRYARHRTTKRSERGFGYKNVLIYTQGGISDWPSADPAGPQPPRLYVSSDFRTVEADPGGKWIFLSNNRTYIAWQPSVGRPEVEEGMDPPRDGGGFFLRSKIDLEDLTEAGETCVLEVGDADLFDSYAQFKQDVKSRNPDFNGQKYWTKDGDEINYLPGSSTYQYSVNGESPFTPSTANWPRAQMAHLQDNELTFGDQAATFDPTDSNGDGFYLEGDVERLEGHFRFGDGGWVPPDSDGLVVLGPPDVEVLEGEGAVFLIAVTGGQPPYQFAWEFQAAGSDQFEPVSVGDGIEVLPSGSLRIAAVLPVHRGSYRVRVEDGDEVADSRLASLTVREPVRVTELLDSVKPLGGRALFSIRATGGDGHYGFSWLFSPEEDGIYTRLDQSDPTIDIQQAPLPDGGEISVLFIEPVAQDHLGWYQVIADDGMQQATSNRATLTLEEEAPALELSSPEDAEGHVGSAASFSVTASGGTGEYTFTWFRRDSAGGSYQAIVPGGAFRLSGGGPFSKLTITPLEGDHAGWYKAVVADSETSVESSAAQLTVTSPPVEGPLAWDSFTNSGAGRQVGEPLDGVEVQHGRQPLRSWTAESSVIFGNSSVAPVASGSQEDHVASVPVLASDTSIAPVLTLTADVVAGTPGRTDWVAVGFWESATGGFLSSAEIWVLLSPTGNVAVHVQGTQYELLSGHCVDLGCDFFPGGTNRLTLEYDTANERVSAWVNGVRVLALAELPEVELHLNHAAIDFNNRGLPDLARVASFRLSAEQETAVPPLSIFPPQSTQATEGESPSFFVTAEGGSGDYSFRWQRRSSPADSYSDVSGSEYVVSTDGGESTLTIESVSQTHAGWYRVKVFDGIRELTSEGAELTVSEAPVTLLAKDDPGDGDPGPFTFTKPTNTGEYWLRHHHVLKNDQPNSGTWVLDHSNPSVGSLDMGSCSVFQCFFYTPPEGFLGGEVTFTYTMTDDGTRESNSAEVKLIIPAHLLANPDPDPETPEALTFWSYQDAYWISHAALLRNDVPNEDTEISWWSDPPGDLEPRFWEQDQSWYFRYDPPPGFAGGEVEFTYRMRRRNTTPESVEAIVKLQLPADLEAVPDPDPAAPQSLAFDVYRDVYWIPHATLLANDIPAGNAYISDWIDPEDGVMWPVLWEGDGNWYFYYDPPTGFAGGEIEFSYFIERPDVEGQESEAALVKVQLPPDLVANDDSVGFATYAATYSFPHGDLLLNDIPTSGTWVSYSGPPTVGELDSVNQVFTYLPPPGYLGGEVEFDYRIRRQGDPTETESENGKVTLTIPPPPTPVARFSAQCRGLTCQFDAGASTGLGLSYRWSFGDSTTGCCQTALHDYGSVGTYTVELEVTDSFGQTAESSQQLRPIEARPDPLSVVFPGPLVLSAGDLLNNDAAPLGADLEIGAITSWPTQGHLQIETATFPDGAILALEYAPHGCTVDDAFSYRLLLEGGTQSEDEGLVTVDVLPDGRPAASFAVSCAGQTCSFTDQSSDDSGYGVSWDFGDGHHSTEPNPVHEYAPGIYTATLTVVDLCEQADFASREVDATGAGSGPTEPTVSCRGLECTFDGSALLHGVTSPRLEWAFGDGSQGTGTTTTHRFPLTEDGVFEVTLAVTDSLSPSREEYAVTVQVLNRRQALVLWLD